MVEWSSWRLAAQLAGFIEEDPPAQPSPATVASPAYESQALTSLAGSLGCRITAIPVERFDRKPLRGILFRPRATKPRQQQQQQQQQRQQQQQQQPQQPQQQQASQPYVLVYCPASTTNQAFIDEVLPLARLVLPLELHIFALDPSGHRACSVEDLEATFRAIRDPIFWVPRPDKFCPAPDDDVRLETPVETPVEARSACIALWARGLAGNAALNYAAKDPLVAALICDGAYSDLPSLVGLPSWLASPFAGLKKLAEDIADHAACSKVLSAPPTSIAGAFAGSGRNNNNSNSNSNNNNSNTNKSLSLEPPWEVVEKLWMPAFYLHGELDRRVPSSCARALRSAHAGESQMLIVKGGTHDSERPQHVLAQMAIFLHRAMMRDDRMEQLLSPHLERLRRASLCTDDAELEAAGLQLWNHPEDQTLDLAPGTAMHSWSATSSVDGTLLRRSLLFAALAVSSAFCDYDFKPAANEGSSRCSSTTASASSSSAQLSPQFGGGSCKEISALSNTFAVTLPHSYSEVTIALCQTTRRALSTGRVAGSVRFVTLSGKGLLTVSTTRMVSSGSGGGGGGKSQSPGGDGLNAEHRKLVKKQLAAVCDPRARSLRVTLNYTHCAVTLHLDHELVLDLSLTDMAECAPEATMFFSAARGALCICSPAGDLTYDCDCSCGSPVVKKGCEEGPAPPKSESPEGRQYFIDLRRAHVSSLALSEGEDDDEDNLEVSDHPTVGPTPKKVVSFQQRPSGSLGSLRSADLSMGSPFAQLPSDVPGPGPGLGGAGLVGAGVGVWAGAGAGASASANERFSDIGLARARLAQAAAAGFDDMPDVVGEHDVGSKRGPPTGSSSSSNKILGSSKAKKAWEEGSPVGPFDSINSSLALSSGTAASSAYSGATRLSFGSESSFDLDRMQQGSTQHDDADSSTRNGGDTLASHRAQTAEPQPTGKTTLGATPTVRFANSLEETSERNAPEGLGLQDPQQEAGAGARGGAGASLHSLDDKNAGRSQLKRTLQAALGTESSLTWDLAAAVPENATWGPQGRDPEQSTLAPGDHPRSCSWQHGDVGQYL